MSSRTKSGFDGLKYAVVYMAHDGITSHYAGIGTYSMCYIYSLPKIAELVAGAGGALNIFMVTPRYQPSFYGYKKDLMVLCTKICRKYDGELFEVDDGLGGTESYGGIKNWELVSKQAADIVADLAEDYDRVIVVAVDTPFLMTGEALFKKYPSLGEKVTVVLSPQSTERIHRTGVSNRFRWEKRRFAAAVKYPSIKISYSSLFLKNHLKQEYGLASSRMVMSMSGIIFDSPRYKRLSQKKIRDILVSRGLPLDRKIVFSVGRLEAYKGFEDTMRICKYIDHKIKPYLVLVGVSYIPNNPLLPRLRKIKKELGLDGKLIFNLDLELPTALWQWSNCLLSAHISRYEPFGLAPVEARYLAGEAGPVVVVSDQGGLKEQVKDGYEGFVVKYGNQLDYQRVANKVSKMSASQSKLMRKRARENVIERYDARRNILALLGEVDTRFRSL